MAAEFDVFDMKRQWLELISERSFETYEIATKEVIKELNNQLVQIKSNMDLISEEINDITERGGTNSFESSDIISDMSDLMNEKASTEEHLLALEGMKIIYLFLSLELRIKSLIKKAYPDKDFSRTYKWENMISLFKNLDINIEVLDGYPQVEELRKINNCIKHAGEINADERRVLEFSNATELSPEILVNFHNRVKKKILDFSKALGQAIIHDLYDFDDYRLENISLSFANRMDKETAEKFTEKLNSRINQKSTFLKIFDFLRADFSKR